MPFPFRSDLAISESKNTARYSVVHAPRGSKTNGQNWIERDKPGGNGMLPAYIENVRNGIMRSGKSESQATAIAISQCKRWAAGGGDVSAEVRAAAGKAIAEWEAMKARAAAKRVREEDAGLGLPVQEKLRSNTARKGDSDYGAPGPKSDAEKERDRLLKRDATRASNAAWDESKHSRAGKGTQGGGRFISKGDSGSAVAGVQRKLGGSQQVTGTFDINTVSAVRSFQKRHGLQVDGVVGRQTMAALNGRYREARAMTPGALDRVLDGKSKRKPKGSGERARGGVIVESPFWDPLLHPKDAIGRFKSKPGGKLKSVVPDLGVSAVAGRHEAGHPADPIPTYPGKPLTFGKRAGGSNGARWAAHEDGSKWLVKTYNGHRDRIATELTANAVYRAMGARVPKAGKLKLHNGKVALTYPALDGAPRPYTFHENGPNSEIGKHFMTDALLANWDVAGLEDDNILWDKSGSPFRVDQGGSLFFRAQGGRKDFGPVPYEVTSMMQKGGQGRRSSKVSLEQMRSQARDLARTLTDERIDGIVREAGFTSKMADKVSGMLKARVSWMKEFGDGQRGLPEWPPRKVMESILDVREAPVKAFFWDPLKHPRNAHGEFVDVLGKLNAGQAVKLDPKTAIKKDKDGTFRVTRSGAIIKGFSTPGDAARAALDRSVKGADKESVGGESKHKDYNAFLKSQTGIQGVDNVPHFEQANGKTNFGGKLMSKEELGQEVHRLEADLQAAQASEDKYVKRSVPTLKARFEEAKSKFAGLGGKSSEIKPGVTAKPAAKDLPPVPSYSLSKTNAKPEPEPELFVMDWNNKKVQMVPESQWGAQQTLFFKKIPVGSKVKFAKGASKSTLEVMGASPNKGRIIVKQDGHPAGGGGKVWALAVDEPLVKVSGPDAKSEPSKPKIDASAPEAKSKFAGLGGKSSDIKPGVKTSDVPKAAPAPKVQTAVDATGYKKLGVEPVPESLWTSDQKKWMEKHPVGSKITSSGTGKGTSTGGEWEVIGAAEKGTVLLRSTDGKKTHTLAVAQFPDLFKPVGGSASEGGPVTVDQIKALNDANHQVKAMAAAKLLKGKIITVGEGDGLKGGQYEVLGSVGGGFDLKTYPDGYATTHHILHVQKYLTKIEDKGSVSKATSKGLPLSDKPKVQTAVDTAPYSSLGVEPVGKPYWSEEHEKFMNMHPVGSKIVSSDKYKKGTSTGGEWEVMGAASKGTVLLKSPHNSYTLAVAEFPDLFKAADGAKSGEGAVTGSGLPLSGKKPSKPIKGAQSTEGLKPDGKIAQVKELDLAVGDVVQLGKGKQKMELLSQGPSGTWIVQASSGKKKYLAGWHSLGLVEKADGSKVKLKDPDAAPSATASQLVSIDQIKKDLVPTKVNIGDLPDGYVIETPDGKIGIIKKNEKAYEGYVAAYDIETGQKFEPPKGKPPVKVGSDPDTRMKAQKMLDAANKGTTVQTASKAKSAQQVGEPEHFKGLPKNEAAAAVVAKSHKKIVGKQAAAVKSYTNGGYQGMNGALRDSNAPKTLSTAEAIKNVDDAIAAQGAIEEPIVLTRKTNAKEWVSAGDNIVGMAIQDNGFLSTSTHEATWDGSVHLTILVPKGAKAIHPNSAGGSSHPGENEVILPRGSQFKVVKREVTAGGKVRLYVELMV